jgi:hypothetical protein
MGPTQASQYSLSVTFFWTWYSLSCWVATFSPYPCVSQARTSLTRREKCYILWCCKSCNLRVSQTSKIIIKNEKLVLDLKFSQDSRVKISNDSRKSRYEISVCETRESRYEFCLRDAILATKFFSVRLIRSGSRYEISVCDTHEKQVLKLILTRESRENLARTLGLKSESRFLREFQKVILGSTLVVCRTLKEKFMAPRVKTMVREN